MDAKTLEGFKKLIEQIKPLTDFKATIEENAKNLSPEQLKEFSTAINLVRSLNTGEKLEENVSLLRTEMNKLKSKHADNNN
jgi:sialic acid synthase SpsE